MSHENTARPLILKRVHWPAADRAAWEALFTEGDIFDGAGPCCHWSQGSRTKREQSYGHWLGYCLTPGALDPLRDVTDRATEDTIRGFLDFEMNRCSPRTVQMHVEDLLVVFRAMSPDKDWKWLAKIAERLEANCNTGELKPRLGISATEIYAWAQTRMREIDRIGGASELRRAALFRDALMVGVLIAIPLRLRTFIAIELERHLNRRMSGFVLSFGPDDMKDRRSHEFVLPTELAEPMQQYLRYYRSKLLGGKSSSRLWITRRRKPFTYWGFQRQLPQLTLKEFGIALRPHAFRSIAATTIATDHVANRPVSENDRAFHDPILFGMLLSLALRSMARAPQVCLRPQSAGRSTGWSIPLADIRYLETRKERRDDVQRGYSVPDAGSRRWRNMPRKNPKSGV